MPQEYAYLLRPCRNKLEKHPKRLLEKNYAKDVKNRSLENALENSLELMHSLQQIKNCLITNNVAKLIQSLIMNDNYAFGVLRILGISLKMCQAVNFLHDL